MPVILLITVTAFPQQNKEQQANNNFFTSFDGNKIYYEVKGSGKAVILIHGFVVNSESWKKTQLYTDLPDAGFKVITIDLRGNGKSDKPHNPEAYENDAEAKDVMKLADHLGLDEYHVVGYSRGAIITSRVLLLDKRVKTAVMGGMGSDFTNPNWPRRIMFYEGLSGKPVKEVQGLVKHIKETGLDQKSLALMQKSQPSTSKEEFSNVKKPVLVICGAEDSDNGSAKDLAALIPKSSFETVPGVHNNASQSQEFSAAVITFITKHSLKKPN